MPSARQAWLLKLWVKEADGCSILKRIAMMKTELRRVYNSRI
ncbi:hypothetical protein T05_6758 [Trichinella murrelli]|uniref:Uncharacterized protein n=1 Tax=Trichinella murrelli TaxID=144512 RepID=A0A0V0SQ90_9BILA|nr:hypothetical protein T05_6758 [Trichinella murrelli]